MSVFLKHKIRLGSYVKLQGGYAFQSSLFKSRGIPIIRISNIGANKIDLKNSVVYYDEAQEIDNHFYANYGDLLIAMSGATTGKCGIYADEKLAYINQRVGKFVVIKHDKILYNYLGFWTQSRDFVSQLTKNLAAGAQPNISPKNIEDMEMFLPDLKTQQIAVDTLETVSRHINNLESLISKQESIKKSTLKLLLDPKDDWHHVSVSDCLDYEQPGRYIVHNDILENLCKTPVLTANKSFIIGYTEETDNVYDKGAVIIYDDFTMDMKYVDFVFKVKSSAIKILIAKTGYDLFFIYSLLKQLELSQQEHARSYISKLARMYIKIPKLEEQKRISNKLQKVDQQLEDLRLELEKYRNIKKGLMDYFFG